MQPTVPANPQGNRSSYGSSVTPKTQRPQFPALSHPELVPGFSSVVICGGDENDGFAN
jgi:hypothetical protein